MGWLLSLLPRAWLRSAMVEQWRRSLSPGDRARFDFTLYGTNGDVLVEAIDYALDFLGAPAPV